MGTAIRAAALIFLVLFAAFFIERLEIIISRGIVVGMVFGGVMVIIDFCRHYKEW